MPIPTLIHPIKVTVERFVRSELLMDADAREPVHGPRTTSTQTVELPAQINWSERDSPQPEPGGVRELSNGYILCRLSDMNRILGAGVRLKRGDRIIKIGSLTDLDLYLTGEEPIAHWQDQNGPTLIKYRFQDRHPTRQKGDL